MIILFNITERSIRELCSSPDVYTRGLKYYIDERVIDVDIDMEEGYVEATVLGSEEYLVQLEFDDGGELQNMECDCPAYFQYDGCCKHIAALLLFLKNMDTKRATPDEPGKKSLLETLSTKPALIDLEQTVKKTESRKYQAVNPMEIRQASEIISFFENDIAASAKNPVNLEVTIETLYDGVHSRGIRPALSLRTGSDKLYVVKSIKNFLKSLDNGSPVEFGKSFTFDPYHYSFRDEDKELVDFLYEMCDADEIIEDNVGYGYGYSFGGKPSLFKGKYLYIPRGSMKRFLAIMVNKPLRAIINGIEYNSVSIENMDIPIEFLLEKSGDDLVLSMGISPQLVPLTTDGRHIFFKGTIYNISKTQSDNLAPFYKAVTQTGKAQLRFPQKDGDRFAAFVIPGIKKAGLLKVDSSIEEMFYQKPLEASVYLDKVGDTITASFSFIYGEYKIDPFDEKKAVRDSNIIIRDYEMERQILDVFEVSSFKINRGVVYLDDDDRIYDFITERIPTLQKICDVYYSESFKTIKLYDSSYYKSSVRFNEESDFLEFSFSIEGIDRESLPEIFASFKQKKKYYRLPDGSFLPLDSEALDNVSDMMEYLDIGEDDLKKDIINLSKFKAMYLDDKLKDFDSAYIERNMAFKKLVDNIKEPKDTDYKVPESLHNIMRGYQVNGFKWLKTLSSYGLGGILADDMGLGKTLQTISFILSEREYVHLPSLVVCPTSLLYNWESEVEKFAPSLKVLVISGNKGEREEIISRINEADIVVTSYPLIRRDIESYKDITFSCCILDEAQHIKNPNSVSAKSVKEIRAKGYFALTGTPIENNLTELWSIFDFLMPGYLLSHGRFVERFEKPITAYENKEALKELTRLVKPFIMRRLKKDVLKELPPKIESTLTAELDDGQKKVYLAYLEQIRGRIEDEIREKGIEKSQIQILAGLTRLRQICCHPSLFIENYDGSSGKMDMLLELIDELKEGNHRALLFSQFTEALKLIKGHLEDKSISYFYLDGSTPADERRDMVKSFNQGLKDVFLISLKAGGTGLNLTGADTVIHFDPWWNPAVEEQATDRAYRIGQQSTVQVMKLITKGTIEEKIFALQQKKKELIDSVLQPGEIFISKMTEEDIRDLFKISTL